MLEEKLWNMDRFLQLGVEDSANFEKSIKNQKMFTFAEQGIKINQRVNGKIQDGKMQRNVFGRLLMVSFKNKIDIVVVFQYHLTLVPLVFGQTDGTVYNTLKSTLMKSIFETTTVEEPKIFMHMSLMDLVCVRFGRCLCQQGPYGIYTTNEGRVVPAWA